MGLPQLPRNCLPRSQVVHLVYRAVVLICIAAQLSLASTGCHGTQAENKPDPAPPPAAVKIAPSTPLNVKAAELLTRRVPRDVRRYCPAFYSMSETDKRAWWAYLFQAMAAAEAGLNATTNVRHTEPEVAVPDHVTGRIVHQEGLLQLSYEDSKRYGCAFDWQADKRLPPHDPNKTILNPERNLACGIRILAHQIIDQHKAIFSPTSYWSTLQPGTQSFAVFQKQMTNPPAACELHTRHHSAAAREIAKQ
jgi:hypothetical protein